MGFFPIVCTVIHPGTPPHPGKIMKMVDQGFLMNSETKYLYRVKDVHEFRFTVKNALGEDKKVWVSGVVVKTYDSFEIIKGDKHKVILVEVHFLNLSEDARAAISSFLSIAEK